MYRTLGLTNNLAARAGVLLLAGIALLGCGDSASTNDATAAAADAASQVQDAAQDAAKSAAATVAAAVDDVAETVAGASDCEATVTVGDTLMFDVTELTASLSCGTFSLTLKHTGNMPAATMGHNWVLVPKGTAQEIGMAGIAAGAEAGYVPPDDRVIAKTKVIGGGETDTISFALDMPAGEYTYVCTFPGHWVAMRGTLTVI
ncbi:MAG: azurin [Pseudomonadota bacterium]